MISLSESESCIYMCVCVWKVVIECVAGIIKIQIIITMCYLAIKFYVVKLDLKTIYISTLHSIIY